MNESALQELCDLRQNPVTPDERKLEADCLWMDELEFETFILGKRRIGYFATQLERIAND